jgi:hypothetical protein
MVSAVVQTTIEKVDDGFSLLLPKELLDACGFGREATVTVENKTGGAGAVRPRCTHGEPPMWIV